MTKRCPRRRCSGWPPASARKSTSNLERQDAAPQPFELRNGSQDHFTERRVSRPLRRRFEKRPVRSGTAGRGPRLCSPFSCLYCPKPRSRSQNNSERGLAPLRASLTTENIGRSAGSVDSSAGSSALSFLCGTHAAPDASSRHPRAAATQASRRAMPTPGVYACSRAPHNSG